MKKVMLTTALLFALLGSAIAQDISQGFVFYGGTFKIDVTQEWTSTNYSIAAGAMVSLVVRGVASTNGVSDWVGPAGDYEIAEPGVGFLLVGWPKNSVIGKIGPTGTPFFVGNQLTFTANKSGVLYLGYNDRSGNFGDNAGYFIAYLVR